jgi:predicted enzyme related to lactoylglutathione lyase
MQQKVNRLLCNICSSDLGSSQRFYTKWFAFEVTYESNWFVHLLSKETGLEIGIIDQDHDLVPKDFGGKANGFYLTMVIYDVDQLYDEIKDAEIEIVGMPRDTFYGQRRMLIKDPDGTLIDVSSMMK